MESVILYRESVTLYRAGEGPVKFVRDAEGMRVFPDRDAAVDYALNHEPFASGRADYQIVELDEL